MQTVFAAIVFAIVFLIVLLVFSFTMDKRGKVARRLKEIDKTASHYEISDLSVAYDKNDDDVVLEPVLSKETKSSPLTAKYYNYMTERLSKASLLYRPKEFFMLSLGTAFTMILIVFILFSGKYQGMYKGFGLVFMVLFTGAIGFIIPNLYLSFRINNLKNRLSRQVGDMILLLSNYLRAGHSFIRSMELVGWELQSPLSDELKIFTKDMNLGASFTEALDDLENRTKDEDLGLVITAIQINHQIGGNLSEILDNISFTIRERLKLKGEIKTLTAQGRMTAIVICLLPVGVALVISLLNPEFMSLLYTNPIGQGMLILAIMMELVGIFIIRKIIEIEV
jgi:tight adherence protein B